MTTGEHLDPESTAPDLPDGYDPLFGTTAERRDWEEWEPWKDEDWLWQDVDPADYGLRRVADLRTAPGLLDGVDELRDADFDDEERRP